MSYAALSERVRSQALLWHNAGLRPGDRVGIAATRSVATVVAILTALETEVAYVPLDLAYPAERLQAMLVDAHLRAVVGDPNDLQALQQRLPAVAPLPTLDLLAARTEGLFAARPGQAYVLFTSGSTGRPKGVAMGSAPLAHLIDWHSQDARLGLPARTLQFAPLSFDVHFQEIVSTIAVGGTLVLIPDAHRRDPVLLRQALVDWRIERLYLPYVALQMLAQADLDAAEDGAAALTLLDVVSAGEQLQVTPAIRALFQRQPLASLHNHYGPTESHVVTAQTLSGSPDTWPGLPDIGVALPHVHTALRDPDTGAINMAEEGELLLGGDCLADGYLGQAALSAERFIEQVPGLPGRWYATGDLVRREPGQRFTHLGRVDQQLKVDGFRIEAGEIELALLAHADITDAAVTAPEVLGARQLMAHVVLREGAAPWDTLLPPLRAQLRAQLPEYMLPQRFVLLDKLPTTPSGKIDRRKLPLPAMEPRTDLTDEPLLERLRAVWCELLGLNELRPQTNVFDVGARSLLVMRCVARLKELGIRLSVADIYDRPTLAGMAQVIEARQGGGAQVATQPRRTVRATSSQTTQEGIAIVGMSVRVGEAHDVDTFWAHLLAGQESIRRFAPHELDPSVPQALRSRPNFVAARGVMEGADRFDAAFFGISAREATVLDPQQRIFLELCWSALEHAAIDPARGADRVGVYAGSANNSYLPAMRAEQPELIAQYGEFATMLASEKDYVATRVSHRLNLNGPAVSIHTACSTSLVAVGHAWHALAQNQCDVALAGGISVVVPQAGGYLHVEGGMESSDGRCRPFDAQASGTIFASGGGVVVLKRLSDALADGDTIYGVIKGVGLNNDGGDKASFTAPSVSGQAQVIRMALDEAGVNARSIGYVEAHGTGTALGDPIEVAALSRAWEADTQDTGFCRLGSIKGHVGHTVAAAGVLGLIKTTLALHREVIPRTLHFQTPNPHIDFAHSPFTVLGQDAPWPRGADLRRAAVSSFGVGGTNAHLIVEEAPAVAGASTTGTDASAANRWTVLPLSARSVPAVLQRAADLGQHLAAHPELRLDDVLATLTLGRQAMPQRLAVACQDSAGAVRALLQLAQASQPESLVRQAGSGAPRLVFLFPGQGSQHPGMARHLVEALPAFAEAFEQCLSAAPAELASKLRHWLVEADPQDAEAAAQLAQTQHAQPALFSVSYALAVWLDSLGIEPAVMIGHSIGELAAACHAGVMSPRDAMQVVIARGQAMQAQPGGAMLAVRASADAVQPWLNEQVELAAVNAPGLVVLAGPQEALQALVPLLEAQQIVSTPLVVSHAFHSASMEGALPAVRQALSQARLQAPRLPVYSCISGKPLRADEACNPDYWARQVRATVQFTRAVQAELAQDEHTLFLEVGPSQALTALLRQHRTSSQTVPRVQATLGPARKPGNPAQSAMEALAALWCAGVAVAWPVPRHTRRATLPTYPFHGPVHWFQRRQASATPAAALSVSGPATVHQTVKTMNRIPRLSQELTRIFGDVAGIPADALGQDTSFVEQGLDSLSLTQATLELERVFGLKLRFRRLLEDLDTPAKLAHFLDAELPPTVFTPEASAASGAEQAPMHGGAQPNTLLSPLPPLATLAPWSAAPGGANPAVQQLIQQQMQLMAQQLALLAGQGPQGALPMAAAPAMATPLPQSVPAPALAAPALATPGNSTDPASAPPSRHALVEKPFGASARITLDKSTDFTPAQRQWLDAFIERYNTRTGKSKAFSQQHRKVMADPRVVTGFNPLWKDLVYPIVVNRSKGARLWDLDGNEYIDLLSAFGANLLGYQPDLVAQAIKDQLDAGMEVGPQHPMAAEVAQLIAEFTGMERVAFCNTGSEAVMGAMRIARTVTGRKTIAIFTNSYHGIFDEVVVRGTRQLRSLSAAPGILANAVENVLVLDYDSEDSLRVLKERAHELAAIMIEPIQNKYPTLQPRAFVQSLREIATRGGCALIFDEVVTGFRVAPGGAQEFYGVRADIATYGKIIGGGLPFAAIAGAGRWLDALDGGHWQYGDDSYPEAGVTYFAGTFVRHPLALAAARASLLHLKAGGRALYRTLNERTQALVERLNEAFSVRGAPVKAVHCASLWRLSWDDDQKNISLFYYLLRLHGLHLYEQFGHFVTEAMGEGDIERIGSTFINALDELMGLGLIRPRSGTPSPRGTAGSYEQSTAPQNAPLTPGQAERWLAASYDAGALRALNESFCLCLRGPIDRQALKAGLRDVLQRHEAFRISFDLDSPVQQLNPTHTIALEEIDLRGHLDADAALEAFSTQANAREFPLDRAPLASVSLLQLADGRTAVYLVTSHLIFDGWAASVFCTELAQAYQARSAGLAPAFAPAESALRFGEQEQARLNGPQGQESLNYWREVLASPPPALRLGDREPTGARTFAAHTMRAHFPTQLLTALRTQARAHTATLFQLLLSAVTVVLSRRSGQNDLVVCAPFAVQSLQITGPLLADGVLDLPLRLRCAPGDDVRTVLAHVREQLMDALEHPVMTQGTIARALGLTSVGSRAPLSGIYFNLNPQVRLDGFGPLEASFHEGAKSGMLNELLFNFYETPDSLSLELHHSSEFFSPELAQTLINELDAQLHAWAQDMGHIATSPAPRPAASRQAGPAKASAAPVVADASAVASSPALSAPELTDTIAKAMAELLHLPFVAADAHFFQLGGHSLQAARLALQISKLVGQRVNLRTLFENPSPMALAMALTSISAAQGSAGSQGQAADALHGIPPRPDQSTAPLSLMQQRLRFLEDMNPGTPYNQLPSGHRLEGPLNLQALKDAFDQVVQRQSALRTLIENTEDGPRQRVLPQWKVNWPAVEDVSHVPAAERDALVRTRILTLTQQVLDFEQQPAFSVHLFRLSPEEHVLFFMVHHMIWDGTSFDLLYEELSAAYSSALAGQPSPLPALPVSYGDFAQWQAQWMEGAELQRQLGYWKDKLSPLPPVLALPTDRSRPARMSGNGASAQRLLGADLVSKLHTVARQHGDTLASLMLAAFSLHLHRLSQQNDFVVATPVRGREQEELQRVMGFFANALPLRMQPQADQPFHQWMQTVQQVLAQAYACPDVPFEHLVQSLGIARDSSRPPLAQVIYSFQDARERLVQWGPLTHSRFDIDLLGSSHDLGLYCVELPQGMEAVLTYNSDVFDATSIERMAASFEALLRQISEAPETPLSTFKLNTESERAVLARWNATELAFDRQATVSRLVEQASQRHGQRTAIIEPERGLISHFELNAKANQLARVLRERGIGRQQLIGLCLPRSIEMVVAQLAVLKAGAAYVPLDPAYPADRLAYMAEDARLSLLITDASAAEVIAWPQQQTLVLGTDAASVHAQSGADLEADAQRDARPMDPAYVIYTSGSTGKPKGVVVHHQGVVNFLDSMAREPGLSPDDRLVAVTTLSFDIAVLELLLPLLVGAQIILVSRETAMDPMALHELIVDHDATVMQATPSTWRLLLESGWEGSPRFKALIGGEALPLDLADALLARTGELWNMYGPTETTVWSTCWRVENPRQGVSVGRPIANTQIHVLDAQLKPCPIGTPGELFIGGDGVTLGYLHREELTAERFLPDPFNSRPGARLYRTGDNARWRHDGLLEHLGRVDFQVKVRGHRIELGEIEAQLLAHPQVSRAVVIVREDHPGDVRLVAYLVSQGGAVGPDQLRQHLGKDLPDYMIPQHFIALDAIPLLPNGKVDRHALPAPSNVQAVQQQPAARSATSSIIEEVWLRQLQQTKIEAGDNFFELGGHSLLAMRTMIELSKRLDKRVSVRLLFENPTLGGLAQAIDAMGAPPAKKGAAALPAASAAPAPTGASNDPMQVPVRPDQRTAPLSLNQQRLWFLENMNPGTPFNQLPSAYRMEGRLNVPAFQQAVQQIVDRQASMRTLIEPTDEGAQQRVLDQWIVEWAPVEDLRHIPQAQREEALLERIIQLRAVPLDFETRPPFMIQLFQLGDAEFAMLFMVHHLVWDGASFGIFQSELVEIYEAIIEGRAPRLEALTVSYGDFSAWQRQWLQGAELAEQLDHWREMLSPLPPVLELPTDHPRPSEMSNDGLSYDARLSAELSAALNQVARAHGVTLSTLLMSAFSLHLYLLSHQDDFAIAVPFRGRTQTEVNPVIGFFANALPIRMRPDGNWTFGHWLRQVQDTVAQAFSYPDVPFEKLVQAMNVPRDASRPLLTQVLYSFQDIKTLPTMWKGIDMTWRGSTHDIAIYTFEMATGIEYTLNYNTDVFEPSTMAHFVECFNHLLQQISEAPATRLSAFTLSTPGQNAALAEWNATEVAYDREATVPQLLARSAAVHGQRTAITQPGVGSISHGELNAQANQLAHALRQRGIGRGALVGLCLDRSIDMVRAQLAVLKAGAAYVPLDPAYPADRLAYMAEDARLALVVTESSWVHVLDWPRQQSLLLDIDAAAIEAQPGSALPPDAQHDAQPMDPAYVIYTSGSTGKPKGVVVHHQGVVNFLSSMAQQPGLNADDRLVAVTTLSFDIAVLELLLPLMVGAEIILASRETTMDSVALRELIETQQATVMQATPSTWRLLIESQWQGSAEFKALIGGESLPLDLAEALLARTGELWNMYGPTETTVWSTCWRVEKPQTGITVGRPIANTQVQVLDEQLKPCPVGVPGELFIGGEGVTLGYLHRPELTTERFIPDPFSDRPGATLYRTGDRARWRHDGLIEHLGRMDFQVKVRGHRIELGEIESQLVSHPQVSRALVIVREDQPGDARLVAYVVAQGDEVSPEALRQHLRSHLPDYMLPQHVVTLDAIPLLPNGKVDRHALPAPNATSTPKQEREAPGTPIQLLIAGVWTRLLQVPQVNLNDNFFDLGGHSLLAMRAIAEINRELGTRLTVRQLIFETLGQIASALDGGAPAPAVPKAVNAAAPAPAVSTTPTVSTAAQAPAGTQRPSPAEAAADQTEAVTNSATLEAERVPQAAPPLGWLGKLVSKLR